MTTPSLTRRRALTGATTVGLALPVLAACGSEVSGSGSGSGTAADPTSTSSAPPTSAATSEATSPAAPPAAATGVASTGDVPVGSGVIEADAQVVVTQPSEGDIKVFSSICTHTGCPVAEVTDTINCRCHGSMFSIEDGSVVGGPAPSPLPAVEFTVDGDQVVLS